MKAMASQTSGERPAIIWPPESQAWAWRRDGSQPPPSSHRFCASWARCRSFSELAITAAMNRVKLEEYRWYCENT